MYGYGAVIYRTVHSSGANLVNLPKMTIRVINFLVDNIIFLASGGQIFQQIVGIPMGTNCAHICVDLVLFSP